jgi:hypothetical protein
VTFLWLGTASIERNFVTTSHMQGFTFNDNDFAIAQLHFLFPSFNSDSTRAYTHAQDQSQSDGMGCLQEKNFVIHAAILSNKITHSASPVALVSTARDTV